MDAYPVSTSSPNTAIKFAEKTNWTNKSIVNTLTDHVNITNITKRKSRPTFPQNCSSIFFLGTITKLSNKKHAHNKTEASASKG